jgi:hypothetical protein
VRLEIMEGFTAEVVLVAQALDVVGLYGAQSPIVSQAVDPMERGFREPGAQVPIDGSWNLG